MPYYNVKMSFSTTVYANNVGKAHVKANEEAWKNGLNVFSMTDSKITQLDEREYELKMIREFHPHFWEENPECNDGYGMCLCNGVEDHNRWGLYNNGKCIFAYDRDNDGILSEVTVIATGNSYSSNEIVSIYEGK